MLVAVLAAIGTAVGVWRTHGGTAAATSPSGLKVTRGDLTVAVGGVGRIVQAGEAASAPPATGGGTAVVAETPGFAVFPRASGQVTAVLVAPGDHVAAGQPVALVNDGGLAAAGISQARVDLATAQLEWRQKRTRDPAKGHSAGPCRVRGGSRRRDLGSRAARAALRAFPGG